MREWTEDPGDEVVASATVSAALAPALPVMSDVAQPWPGLAAPTTGRAGTAPIFPTTTPHGIAAVGLPGLPDEYGSPWPELPEDDAAQPQRLAEARAERDARRERLARAARGR